MWDYSNSQLESVHDNDGDGAIEEDAEDTTVQWTNLGFVELDDVSQGRCVYYRASA